MARHARSIARPGDWDVYAASGAGHTDGLVTYVESKSLLTEWARLSCATAKTTYRATVRRLEPICRLVDTILMITTRGWPARANRQALNATFTWLCRATHGARLERKYQRLDPRLLPKGYELFYTPSGRP